jgi:colicin import membrane protein
MQNEIVIFKALTSDESLTEIELQSEKFVGLTVDMNDAKERKKVKDSAQLISDILKRVDRARIDHAKDYKAKVEEEAAMIIDRLTVANKPLTDLTDAYTAKRKKILDAEKARQATIDLSFSKLVDSAMEAIGQTSSVIEGIIDDVACYDFSPEIFQERTTEAVTKHAELMGKLQHMLSAQSASEELESKRAEVEEKERLQYEADQRATRIKRETEIAEQAKSEAEERHAAQLLENAEREQLASIERENQAAIDKLKAEAEAKQQAEQAAQSERDKIAAEQAEEKARLDKLEANKNHAGAVRKEIKHHVMLKTGLDDDTARKVVMSLLKYDRITINY